MNASDSAQNYFTQSSKNIFSKSTDIAVKTKCKEVKPLHLLLALLHGDDLDVDLILNNRNAEPNHVARPSSPSLLWSLIEQVEGDPAEISRRIVLSVSYEDKKPSGVVQYLALPVAPGKKRFKLPRLHRSRNNLVTPQPSREPSPTPSSLSEEILPSDALSEVIDRAYGHMQKLGSSYLGPYHLIFGVIEDDEVKALLEKDIVWDQLNTAVREREPPKITEPTDDQFPYLSRYATDMTAAAREGKLEEIIGRDEEIRRIVQILCRRTKNSAVLIGEPGVGKTAVVEGLAHRIASNQVPPHLNATIYNLDLGAMFAGAGKGEYEQRVKGVVDDVMRSQESGKPIILFVDEFHLISAGKSSGSGQSSGMDAANLLKPALARGQFRCIGATTLSEYREHIEKDGALERRFAQVIVNEPTESEAITILRGIRERYEKHHNVWIMDNAIVAAVNLAHRYLTSRKLPDSAVDLVDEACSSARILQDMKPEVIDSFEKEKAHLEAYILALQRDDNPEDFDTLADARQRLADAHSKSELLAAQQINVKMWWESSRAQRSAIKEKRQTLNKLRSMNTASSSQIAKLEAELKLLQGEHLRAEQEGPKKVSGLEALAAKFGFGMFMSPDIITRETIAGIVEKMTKIPVQRLLADDKSKLLGLEKGLSQKVVGQLEAVKAVSRAIQVSRTGLGNPNCPIASFLFTGPSGTGKTLLSKALAKELFGQETSMIRIDGSEYSQSHSVSRLIGSPPGYVGYDQGGQLTEYVRRTPYCIVLLDEIEKTCKEFLTLFLQVLDEGRLTDGRGRLVDFRNCVIIMTSNIGAWRISQASEVTDAIRQDVIRDFQTFRDRTFFPPEFLNRVGELILFRTMSNDVMKQILENHLNELKEREGIKKLKLEFKEDAKQWLVEMGISPEYGARPLARAIQRELLNPLSQRLLDGSIQENDAVTVSLHESLSKLDIQGASRSSPRRERTGKLGVASRGRKK